MEPGVVYSTAPKPEPQPKPPMWPLLGGLVVILAIAGAVYLIKQPRQTSLAPTPTSNLYNVPAALPTTAPVTNNWKEFIEPNNLFSIKYPPEYSAKSYQESTFSGVELDLAKPASSASASAQISLKVMGLANSIKTAEQFARDQMALEKNATLEGTSLLLKGEWGRGKIIFRQEGRTVYRLSSIIMAPLNFIPTYESIVDQIFASFTPLNPNDRSK